MCECKSEEGIFARTDDCLLAVQLGDLAALHVATQTVPKLHKLAIIKNILICRVVQVDVLADERHDNTFKR